MMKKRFLALLLAVVMVMSFAACGDGGNEAGADGETVLTFAYKWKATQTAPTLKK